MRSAVADRAAAPVFVADVMTGLSANPKTLPPKYLYDAVGSRLFDVITELPEYGVTRSEERLLRDHSSEMVNQVALPVRVAELGSGSGRKTRYLLEALARRRAPVSYHPIEISRAALEDCERELGRLSGVRVEGIENEYADGLAEVAGMRRAGERLLLFFLGSSIGNFAAPDAVGFLREVRGLLDTGDALLLGTDLEKPVETLLEAYDDPIGVTAAFNRNLLARINRELDADFDIDQFAHEARFNPRARSVEMHLRSLRPQTVYIRAARMRVHFDAGETIWTESSHKYNSAEVCGMAAESGFRRLREWVEPAWGFSENLLIAAR